MHKEEFGKYIATKRKEQNMTQAELARKLNVTAKALNVNITNLFNCNDETKSLNDEILINIVHDSVTIDRKNKRLQEKSTNSIIIVTSLLIGVVCFILVVMEILEELYFLA